MILRKATLAAVLVFISCGFSDAQITGVWLPKKITWTMTNAKIPSAGLRIIYFAPSGKFVAVDSLVEKDERGLAYIDFQDDTGVYFGTLHQAPPTRIKYQIVDGEDYVTPGGKEETPISKNADGTITFGGEVYRRLANSGNDSRLRASFQRVLKGSPGLVGKLSKEDFCLDCEEHK
ncbi:MAG TPA: hypothetical protein VMH86_04350 [Rhizomicrobium sp.]|nr:hypothetical protein [Rhizomicrobium sp.]